MPTFYFGVKMVVHDTVQKRLEEIAKRAAEAKGIEFVHLEIAGTKRNPVFRVFIDKPSGVTIDDCSLVSADIEGVLDNEDPIPGPYVLEVSSPGLDRELYKIEDFRRFTGSLAKVKMKKEFTGPSSLNGRIIGVEGDTIEFEDRSAGKLEFPYEMVAKANLKVDLKQELSRG